MQLNLSSTGCELCKLENLMLGQSWCLGLGVFFGFFFLIPESILSGVNLCERKMQAVCCHSSYPVIES